MDQVKLRDQLVTCFNKGELDDLCFQLGFDYQELPGQTKQERARELIAYCQRHGLIEKLTNRCQELRPHVSWKLAENKPRDKNSKQEKKQSIRSLIETILVGIFITVIGGVIVAYLIRDPEFASTPTPLPTTAPEQFIQDYFIAINHGDYEQSWQMLSANFKDVFHCCNSDGSYQFQPYRDWYSGFDQVEVIKTSLEEWDPDEAIVLTKLKYFPLDNNSPIEHDIRFRLVWENNKWLIDGGAVISN